ncbi:hypothetical protein Vadar_003680 [Vaccinium darrowii]|uniref:Uncharacterized protein n=1 Tax=Vaccinium darrowii TaxID=229202 RepID=A0ACB7ZHM2_9ERIC|nr:hypothetical protein Vadar_003680 [Vaccinium darrowii]
MSRSKKKPILIRQVWAGNLTEELSLINCITLRYPFVSMDTEFPGTIFHPRVEKNQLSRLPPDCNYRVMKANVDALNIVQLGLTLSDADGNLPESLTHSFVWEFNFRDFDLESDLQNRDSVALLEKQGIDFYKNRKLGIDSRVFGCLFLKSRLVSKFNRPSAVTWITFHSAYDFGFLLKILTGGRLLPANLRTFMTLVNMIFGGAVYDIKHMIRFCDGLYGGLERVAKKLGVDRVAGKSHQAGSDSLLTMQTFMKLKELYFNREGGEEEIGKFQCVLHGLEVERTVSFV